MHFPLSAFVALWAATTAYSAPTSQADAERSALKVPLFKRSDEVYKADGVTLDSAKVAGRVSYIREKYARLQKNAAINQSGNQSSKRGVVNLPLVAQDNATFWSGDVQVGGQTLKIDFDTGSSDTVINKGHYKPGPGSVETKGVFLEFYGSLSNITTAYGKIYKDTVSIGDLKATEAYVGLITGGADVLRDADGVVGLAYPSLSSFGVSHPPLIDVLINENQLASKSFAFALALENSELTFGGLDNSKYTGEITYLNVTGSGFWQVNGTVNGFPISSVVDSGTTLVVADTDSQSAQKFFSKMDLKTYVEDNTLYAEVDCEHPPTITFDYGGKEVTLSKESAIYGKNDEGNCVLSIVGTSLGLDAWITGDPVFLNSYVVFDRDQNRVGFATRS
ncbi:unnamed protein product [Parajaminaea phylloscopi]